LEGVWKGRGDSLKRGRRNLERCRWRNMTMIKNRTTSYRESLLKSLKDPEEAVEYLNAALEEDDEASFILALRNVAEARGMSVVAAEAELNRVSLYRLLSARGNPKLHSLWRVLDALGLRLSVNAKGQSV
jgi:probable addiction module antidote protein